MTLLVLFNQPAGGPANYAITANTGSYAVGGVAATIKKTKVLAGAVGTYTYTGVVSTLARSKAVGASSGAYAYAGVAATLTYIPAGNHYSLTANLGAYSVNGVASTINKTRILSANTGTYSVVGKAATISYSPVGGSAVWPNPSDVRLGITYGPTGAEYIGTAPASRMKRWNGTAWETNGLRHWNGSGWV